MRYRWFQISSSRTRAATGAARITQAFSSTRRVRAASHATPGHEPRLALLIGNARYRDDRLKSPVEDVRSIAWALEGVGFDVTLVENATLQQMQDAAIGFGERLDQAGADAVALIYYAGHGIEQDGINFLIPVDAEIPSLRYLEARALRLDALVAELRRVKRKANIVIIDACRNAFGGLEPDAAQAAHLTAGLSGGRLPHPAMLVYSTASTALAADGWGKHSPFAEALADEVKTLLTPGRRLQDAIDDVAARVSVWTDHKQTVAVYREGVLPPLTLNPDDEERLRDWSKRPYRLTAGQIGARAGIAAAGLLTAACIGLWATAWPETRTTWLLRAGLIDSPAYDFSCAPPWDDVVDQYGLTRRDWCLTMGLSPDAIIAVRETRGSAWEQSVEAGVAAGDPKAVALRAIGKIADGTPESLKEAAFWSVRASATDLPLGWFLPALLQEADAASDIAGYVSIRAQVRDAALAGVLGARVAEAGYEYADKRLSGRLRGRSELADEVEKVFSEFSENDPGGGVAYLAATHLRNSGAHPERWRAWLRKAAFAGDRKAGGELFESPGDLLHGGLQPEERVRLLDILLSREDGVGLFAAARQMREKGALQDEAAYVELLSRSALLNFEHAAKELWEFYLSDRDGRGPDGAAAVRWLEHGVARRDARAHVRLGTLLARGVVDSAGRAVIAQDRPRARELLEAAASLEDKPAMQALADLLSESPDPRDLRTAARLYATLAGRIADAEIGVNAQARLAAMNRKAELASASTLHADIPLGRPDAPVHVIAYIDLACANCPDFATRDIDRLYAEFGERGVARFTVRQVWELGDRVAKDFAMLVACAPPPQRLRFFRKLFESVKEWDMPEDAPRRAALARAAEGFPLSRSLPECLGDSETDSILTSQRQQAFVRLGMRRAVTVFVDGEMLETGDYGPIKRTIEAKAPRGPIQLRPTRPGPGSSATPTFAPAPPAR